jgi:hypothetical protein
MHLCINQGNKNAFLHLAFLNLMNINQDRNFCTRGNYHAKKEYLATFQGTISPSLSLGLQCSEYFSRKEIL